MSSSGEKSKRYYTSKNFYRYIRPGAYRIGASATDQGGIYPLAFKQDAEKTHTIILINDTTFSRPVKLSGAGLPATYSMFVTNETEDCKDHGSINANETILLPPKSVITLYRKN